METLTNHNILRADFGIKGCAHPIKWPLSKYNGFQWHAGYCELYLLDIALDVRHLQPLVPGQEVSQIQTTWQTDGQKYVLSMIIIYTQELNNSGCVWFDLVRQELYDECIEKIKLGMTILWLNYKTRLTPNFEAVIEMQIDSTRYTCTFLENSF